MKTTAAKTDWLAVAKRMLADKKRINHALVTGMPVPDAIRFVKPAAF